MDLQSMASNFMRGMGGCDDLEKVHGQSGGSAPGRRWHENSINPAIVVLAIAAWQALVQDMAAVCVEAARPDGDSPLSLSTYHLLAGNVKGEIDRFSTPNAQNSRRLLQLAGFDPRPCWTWRAGRSGEFVGPADVEAELDQWLKIRHAVAHGDPKLPEVPSKKASATNGRSDSERTLRLTDARRCMKFVRRLAKSTGDGLAVHLGVEKVAWDNSATLVA